MSNTNIATLVIDFTWTEEHRCSSKSPEIKVSGVPEEATHFKVNLVDLDVPFWNHGGGTTENDGSGVIAEGTLKEGYNGPCPPSGSHRYEFTVNAVDANENIIGTGKKMKQFP
ncbi:MAG: YbhB/YbcL family Raf kinase inhibitor-like protein [Thermodesulfobacteriota bacterium]|nr:YbhB/YbcL family Raf kinase inhibitor-like protein [Thermodesulfobacteriota bacterium]